MISILITTHNYGHFLKKCLESVLSNNLLSVKEIIVIDDSSIDNTKNIVKKFYIKNKKIKYFFVNFKLPSKSKNFAAKLAKGKWLTFIDGDDYVSKNYIRNFNDYLKSNEADFIYSNLKIKKKKNIYEHNQKRKGILYFIDNPHGSGCLIKKKIWQKVKGISENLKYQDDFDFWCKINLIKKIKIIHLDSSKYFYRKHNTNRSKNIFKKYFYKIYLILKYFNIKFFSN